MAKQISKNDIAEDDIFGAVKQSAENAILVIDKLNTELKESASILSKDIKGVKFGSTKEIKEFTKAIQEANKLKQDSIKLDTERAKLIQQVERISQEEERTKQQKIKTEKEELALAVKLKAEKEKENKVRQRAIKLENDENNAYKKLVKSTRDQKNESKRLAVELINLEKAGKRNTKEFKKLNAQYKKVTASAQKGDKALKKIDSTVGDNFRNVGNYRQAVGKLTTVLSGLGLAFGGFQLIKGAGETIADFGQQVADLSAITGASEKDLKFYQDRAIETGTKIEGGASKVIEAYKLIGSAKPELLENAKALDSVTQSAILLSQASGLDLPEAATRLTDAMNQFGAPAEEAGRFIDVLANGAKFGSAEIPQVTDALLKFGAVAKTSNVSLEESTALIELLAEKGLKGAEAGTGLRNVMLKLSAPDALPKEAQEMMKKLGISFEEISDPSKSFAERLKAMKPLLSDNASLQKVFGRENAVVAINLLEGTERVEDLTKKMDTLGTAQDQANTRTDTLSGAFTELKNTWNNWILSISNGKGIGEGLKSLIQTLANNFGLIVSTLGKVIRIFLIYKATTSKVAKSMGGLVKLVGRFNGNIFKMIKTLRRAKGGLSGASSGLKKMGKAMKGIGFSIAIDLAIRFVTELWNIVSGSKAAKEAEEARAEAIARAEESATILVENYNKSLAEKIRLLDLETRALITNAKTQKEKDDIALQAIKNQKKLTDDSFNSLEKIAKKEAERLKLFTKSSARVSLMEKKLLVTKGAIPEMEKLMADLGISIVKVGEGEAFRAINLFETFKKFSPEFSASRTKVVALSKALKEMQNSSEELGAQIGETAVEIKRSGSSSSGSASKVKELNSAFSDQIQLTKELNDLKEDQLQIDEDLSEIDLKDNLREQNALLEEQIRLRTEEAKEGNVLFTDNKDLADFSGLVEIDEIKKIILEKQRLQIASEKETEELKIQALRNGFDERFRLMQLSLDKELKTKLAQEGLTPEQKTSITAGFDREQADLNTLKLAEKKILDGQIIVIEKDTQSTINEIKKDSADEQKEIVEELNSFAVEANSELIDKEKADADKRLENQKAWATKSKAIIKAVSDFFIKKSNEKIAGYEKEISEAEKQSDVLQQLAINGNITAKESLAEQQKIIAEANKKKLAEERKQIAIKQAEIFLETYLSKVEAGDKTPLLSAIKDFSLLTAFISTIPAFMDGTEDTGVNGRGIDGKGGFNAILHPNERVLTKEQNSKIGNLSNNELANFAQDYNTGKIINGSGAIQIGNGWNSGAIVERLESLEKTIKDKPETNIRVEDIVTGAMTITRQTKKGNSVIYNRYQIKN